jgi:hypothetical protein
MKKCLFFLLIIFLSACSGVKVLNTETGDNVDFAKYKTFDFYHVRASGDTMSNVFDARMKLLKESIAAELTQRGYQQSSDPDILVNIGIRIKEQVQTRQTDWQTDGAPRYIGQRNYSWKSEEIEVGRYREGTVAIHLVDAAKKQMIWKGVMQGVVPDTKRTVEGSAQKSISKLFERFPVPVK